MATSINTLKNWFRTGLKPTQAQFWAWLDSYRHKDEAVPVRDVSGLQELLDTKVDKKELVQPDQVGPYDPLKAYVFDAAVAEYVSYVNPQSTNPQYQVEGFYRLKENAPAGENPETHPAHWVYQGTVLGDIAIEDVVGLREELDALANNSGGISAVVTSTDFSGNGQQATPLSANETWTVESVSDYAVVTRPYAFRIESVISEIGLSVTLLNYADNSAYQINTNVPEFGKVKAFGNLFGKSFTLVIKPSL